MWRRGNSTLISLALFVTAFSSAQAGYVDLVRDDPGLISYWSFEEETFAGGNASDFTGLSDAPYGNGIVPVEGIVGQAAGFSGTGVIEIPNESEYDFTEAMTIEAWFRTDAMTLPWQALVGKGDNQWRLHRLRETGGFTFGTNDGSNPTDMFRDAEDEIPTMADGEWHHIVGVFDFANTQFLDGPTKRLYLDGVLVGEQEATAPIRSECGANCELPVMIGGNAQKPDEGFRAYVGIMDEVAIYDRALEEVIIQAHYESAFIVDGPACDFNGDESCDISDIDMLMTSVAAQDNDATFDLNGDGSVDDADRDAWLSQSGTENGLGGSYLVGDANLDGTVDAQDLNALALQWQSTAAKWSDGNYTGVDVNAQDLNAMALNWQKSSAAAAAPVPGTRRL